ncbi:BON domain-containing protein [Orrella marina]|nr:BON domain-containing protein [Orrella marina]
MTVHSTSISSKSNGAVLHDQHSTQPACPGTSAMRLVLMSAMTAMSLAIAGCAPMVVGSAALTTASIASDPRTTGQQLEDTEIEFKTASLLQSQFSELARINASSYNGVVLLTGDASDAEVRNKAVSLVSGIPNVKSVIDRINVGSKLPFSQVTADTWLSSKIRTTLIATRGIPSGSLKVTVEDGNVYIQGIVTQQQASDIARTVSSISGVKEVFTLFDIRSEEEINRLRGGTDPNPVQTGGSGASASQQPATSTSVAPGPTPSTVPVLPQSSPQARPI